MMLISKQLASIPRYCLASTASITSSQLHTIIKKQISTSPSIHLTTLTRYTPPQHPIYTIQKSLYSSTPPTTPHNTTNKPSHSNKSVRTTTSNKAMSFTKEVEFYYASTPNGWKIEIALEEMGIPYKLHKIDFSKNDQFNPEYLKLNPNNKIPTIVDPNAEGGPLPVFESGAILIYLAQKAGKFLPDAKTDPAGNADVIQWLMWQMAGLGPMLGQFNHFNSAAPEKIPYAIDRYKKETERLFKVLDTQLATTQFVAKSGYPL